MHAKCTALVLECMLNFIPFLLVESSHLFIIFLQYECASKITSNAKPTHPKKRLLIQFCLRQSDNFNMDSPKTVLQN